MRGEYPEGGVEVEGGWREWLAGVWRMGWGGVECEVVKERGNGASGAVRASCGGQVRMVRACGALAYIPDGSRK